MPSVTGNATAASGTWNALYASTLGAALTTQDSEYADTIWSGGMAGNSGILYISGFGLTMPAGATITGIAAEFIRGYGINGSPNNNSVKDVLVQLLYGGSLIGSNLSAGAYWPTGFETKVFGADGALWGATLTQAMVVDGGFGVAIQVYGTSAPPNATTAFIDRVRLTAYYTLTAAGGVRQVGYSPGPMYF